MKRFLKTFCFLIVSLFLVVSGVNTALDHLSHAMGQNSFTVYDEQGAIVLAYSGDLSLCKTCVKPASVLVPNLLHRT